ncbi:MAG: protein-L-isoaspartate(D-aspartate) O-methyltransferase [Candidatus Aenigmarchaeota archaeon]|nr:protein-L-isoaspartate(D-aspartate) O-methyltransferase [Candidatus Aenigmarchaeota archaeon]
MSEAESLAERLHKEGYIKTANVRKAFLSVPRELFVMPEHRKYAYADEPLPLFSGQTISAPHMVAMMAELVSPEKGDKCLEIGAGSGYQAAILSRLCRKVYAMEIDPMLAEFAERNLKLAEIKNVEVIVSDGSKGYEKKKPYDIIVISCGIDMETFRRLARQLKDGGRIAAPVSRPGDFYQELILGVKEKKSLRTESHGGCAFVRMRE